MKLTLRALSALLGYPSAELQAHVPELRAALLSEAALPAQAIRTLEPLFAALETDPLIDRQAAWCELFDSRRSLSLHIFEHVHGDSRDRGPAMVDLGKEYAARGLVMTDDELPDYAPLFLEFVSTLDRGQAREWLREPAHVFAALAERLDERKSPYAAVFHAIVTLPGARPDRAEVARLAAEMAAHDARPTDETWEDAEVTFGTPAEEESPTDIVAKIRAARRAVRAQPS